MTKTARKSPAKKPANLPRWNLNDLYKGMTDPKLEKDFKWAESHAQDFKKTYEGYLSTLNGEALAAAIEAYEKIDEVLGRIMSYAYLLYSTNQEDSKIAGFYQGAQERVTAISTFTLFFALELNKVDDAILRKQLQSAAIQKYEPWIRDIRVFRPHQLSQEIEQKLHEKRVVGRAAWNRLFDETLAGMRFPYQGKHLTEAEILNLFSNPKREVRAKAAHSFAKVLSDNIKLFALITNTLAKDKEIEDTWRKFPKPISYRNLSNFVEDEVVEALVASVKRAYPRLSHRYYQMKAGWLKLKKLEYYDRNAPLPKQADKLIPWPKAKSIVLESYG
ncbi:MAG: M3 family oligoendopeptidase, partial [Dongiaceae bacterium]